MSRVSTALLFVFLASPYTLRAQSQASAPSAPLLRSAYGEKLKFAGLPNGGKISDSLFRGAQPRAEGFDQLKNLGITTIVDLRGEDAGKIAWERQQAESRGIRFVNIPLSGWSPPTNEQIAQFLSLFKNEHEKVFVHCRYGEDRTGVFVAAYRLAHDSWTPSETIKEMYFFGFNGFFHPAMKSYINGFPSTLKTSPALASFAPLK